MRRDTLNTIYSQSNSISICEKLICSEIFHPVYFHISAQFTSPNHYLSEWDDWEKQGLPEEQRTRGGKKTSCMSYL
ncbi:leucine-rich repeat domain-containing protein [Shigella flexneri]